MSEDSTNTMLSWYHMGVDKIESHSVSIGLSYLDKAIPAFAEAGDLRMLSLARHHRLRGLGLSERHEEVEREYAHVMEGYTAWGNHYGKALLIVHLAESLAVRERWERAHSYYHLASVIAENFQYGGLLAYTLYKQAQLCAERDNHHHATGLLKRAERFVSEEGSALTLANIKCLRGEILHAMGEISEAAALLEEALQLYTEAEKHHEAMKPLNLLRNIYAQGRMSDEQERISRLMYIAGQKLLRQEMRPMDHDDLGPPIEPPGMDLP